MSAFALLLATIDAVAGQVVFQIDGPGEIFAYCSIFGGNFRNDEILRSDGRKSITRGDKGRHRIVGLNGIPACDHQAAYLIYVRLCKIEERVLIRITLQRRTYIRYAAW